MENLILEWQKRQQKYEELADKYKDDAHNNRKFTYKAMATRDCWKELALQLLQPDVSQQRDQLIAFLEMNNWFSLEDRKNAEGVVDCYLKAINCG